MKKYKAGSTVCSILNVFGIIATVLSLLSLSRGMWLLHDVGHLALYALISFYALIGYDKPHGNLLKYILLFHGALCVLAVPALVQGGNTASVILLAIEMGLTCYIAGRLAKAKENLILMLIATVCLVARQISVSVAGIATIGVVSPVITWLDICVAYFLRYKEHKEAGLQDAPKK